MKRWISKFFFILLLDIFSYGGRFNNLPRSWKPLALRSLPSTILSLWTYLFNLIIDPCLIRIYHTHQYLFLKYTCSLSSIKGQVKYCRLVFNIVLFSFPVKLRLRQWCSEELAFFFLLWHSYGVHFKTMPYRYIQASIFHNMWSGPYGYSDHSNTVRPYAHGRTVSVLLVVLHTRTRNTRKVWCKTPNKPLKSFSYEYFLLEKFLGTTGQ